MTDFTTGDRVTFSAREYGAGHPLEGTPVTLHGTVKRPPWGRGPNVSIDADDGRVFCRLAAAVRHEPDLGTAQAHLVLAGLIELGFTLDEIERAVRKTSAIHFGYGEHPEIPRFGADEEVS